MTDHYQSTLELYRKSEAGIIAFGRSAMVDIDRDNKTIRQMSIDLCGNVGLEDRLQRWIYAARWDALIEQGNGTLYEDARNWLSPSHFTLLWQAQKNYDVEHASDLMEQCLIRDLRKDVKEVRPVTWLQPQVSDSIPSTEEIWHKVFMISARALTEAYSRLAKLGNDAGRRDRRKVRVLQMAVKEFQAEEE